MKHQYGHAYTQREQLNIKESNNFLNLYKAMHVLSSRKEKLLYLCFSNFVFKIHYCIAC